MFAKISSLLKWEHSLRQDRIPWGCVVRVVHAVACEHDQVSFGQGVQTQLILYRDIATGRSLYFAIRAAVFMATLLLMECVLNVRWVAEWDARHASTC